MIKKVRIVFSIALAVIVSAANKSVRQRWELGRFLRTANFYGALTPKIALPFLTRKSSKSKLVSPGDVLWNSLKDDGKCQSDFIWGPLDDVVMGGVSKSDLNPGEAFKGLWSGFTSSANNGGFAGIRTKTFNPPLDLGGCKGIRVKLMGDGQRYKMILRDDDDWNGIAWSHSFDTVKGRSIDISIPFEKFSPTRFARRVPMVVPFRKNSLAGVQLTLSKFEYEGDLNPKFVEGPFSVKLESLQAF
jgi:hypothetical protein